MKHDVALKVAEALVEHLRPACWRIEIAGSIRRMKPEVKDIEIVAIPDLSIEVPRAKLEFGKSIPLVHKTKLDQILWEETDDIRIEKGGERYKKIYLRYAGINLDLFLVLPPAQWGVQMVIRTGPAEFSHWMVSRQKIGGALPNGYRVQDGAVWLGEKESEDVPGQKIIGFATELEFLQFCGMGWLEPRERLARWTK